MTIHNYYRIVDDVKKIIYNLELLMVMISSLHRIGVDKMSVLTLADKTTRMLVKIFKNFKCKYKHFISNVMDRYNRIMVMLYIRVTCVYKMDERILKNCIYMIYNDYSKYYIYNDFTDHDKKYAESDAYVNGLFCKIVQVLSDFIKFIECKIAKYGNVTRVGYEGCGKGRDVSSYSSHGLAEKHIGTKYGSKHKGKGSDTSSHDRYIKSSTDRRLTSDSHGDHKHKPHNKFESDSTREKCEDSSKADIFNKVDKHHKKHNDDSDSSSDSFDPKKFKHKKHHSLSDHKHKHRKHNNSSEREDCKPDISSGDCKKESRSTSSLPEVKYSSKDSEHSFIVSNSSPHSTKSCNSSSMSEFSFMEFDKRPSECAPEVVKEMNFLIEHGDANPNGDESISTDYVESSDDIELDAIRQQKYLIDNNIQNPNNSRKYKKVCEELTCNSSDIKISESDHKHHKSKLHELTFDKTSEVCDYPISETILVCNDSPSSSHSSDKKHKHIRKHKHTHHKHKDKHSDHEHKHTSSKKHKSHDPVLLSVSCDLAESHSPKKKCVESVDTLMCNDSVSFSDACEPRDKICEKYKHYIPQTKKILKSLHEMLKCSRLDEISKRDMYNTVMRIKHNKHMYHIFKVVARQCDCDFDEMVKAVCKMSMVC